MFGNGLETAYNQSAPEPVDATLETEDAIIRTKTSQNKKLRTSLIILVAAIVAVGIGVGLGLGLSSRRSSSSPPATATLTLSATPTARLAIFYPLFLLPDTTLTNLFGQVHLQAVLEPLELPAMQIALLSTPHRLQL